jgi:hypothetical protein
MFFPRQGVSPGWREHRIFPVKLTAVTEDSGTFYYDGTEQTIDPATGDYTDASPAMEFDDTSCYLFELNNTEIDVSAEPVVWARFRGMYEGVPSFEFLAGGGGVVRGVLDGGLSMGGSATMSVWAYDGSDETDTGDNITVYDWLLTSGSIASGVRVIAAYDEASGRYYVIARAPCTVTFVTDICELEA